MQLSLLKINKSFDTNHVLKDISFKANSGTAFGLLGRNGSGKTTTIRIIMDIFSADSGEVLIDGKKLSDSKVKIGYLPEERGLYPKKLISEQMIYIGELRGMRAKDAKKSAEELLEKIDATQYFNKRLDTLSKGNQQKIQLAIALLNDPDIIILDEPFSGLDPVNARLLKDLVAEMSLKGKMVIFSSHQMGSVEAVCDDICIINQGKIVLDGNLKRIKKSYPRNKILLVPESSHIDTFSSYISTDDGIKKLISSAEKTKSGYIVTLFNEKDKFQLFNMFSAANIDLDSFMVVEPTLEEIFVERAGDENEAV